MTKTNPGTVGSRSAVSTAFSEKKLYLSQSDSEKPTPRLNDTLSQQQIDLLGRRALSLCVSVRSLAARGSVTVKFLLFRACTCVPQKWPVRAVVMCFHS